MIRAFISIDIPENAKLEIKKIQEKLPQFFGKKIDLDNLHLTLKFLGEIDEKTLDEVKKRLEKIDFSKFNIKLGELGVFSPKFIKIIWIKLNGADRLQKQIDEELDGLFKKEKRFMSHLTIGRVKKVNTKRFLEDLKKISVPDIGFTAESFELKKSILNSVGPHYETLEKYN